MGDHETVRGPYPGSRYPAGKFKRMWTEFEVEVVNEDALRAFDLHHTSDEHGNVTGFLDLDINERAAYAVSRVMNEALQAAVERTGVRWLGGSGPSVRVVDESGNYTEFTLPAMPQRRDDGSYDDMPEPTEES